MKANLKSVFYNPIILWGIFLFAVSSFVTSEPYLLMLSAAQLIFVPVMLRLLMTQGRVQFWVTMAGMLSVALMPVVSSGAGQIALALIYVLFTFFVLLLGVLRFFTVDRVSWSDISINVGMMYLFVGGLWYFAYVAGIDTGFSPLITWLTAIHFHYSAFLLPVSLGLFGRLYSSRLYRLIVVVVLTGPMLVAIGITYSRFLELISVLLYILGIYSLIFLSFRVPFANRWQAVFVRLSYAALGVTILFSLAYAGGNLFGRWTVSIDFMLAFHGFLNCVVFGLAGVLGWAMSTPERVETKWNFPRSQIRGKLESTGLPMPGLVENMSYFVDPASVPQTIVHFYEQTSHYRLVASVKWSWWFKPFAVIYKLISRRWQQLNLPLSEKEVEMKGEIVSVDAALDGRVNPRAWIRKVDGETVFTAIYSQHETGDTRYLNIALPLPFSSMIGILKMEANDGTLILTSRGDGDEGIYLAAGRNLYKLPLSEHFIITETKQGKMTALHQMKVFGVRFLRIDYEIGKRGI